MPLRPGLIRPPLLRFQQDGSERHATWLELFFDLAFVAVIGQVSAQLVKSHAWGEFTWFFLLFIPLWWAWVGQAFYLSRFDADDLSHRVTTFFQIVVLAIMGTTIDDAFAGNPTGFILGYVTLRCVLVGQYIYAGRFLPEARRLTNRYAAGFSFAIACWLISLALPSHLAPWLWMLGILIDFATPFTANEENVKIPPHAAHIPERFGLFTIIVLGESIIAGVISLGQAKFTPLGIAAGICGLLLACGTWWIYFEGVGGANERAPSSVDDVGKYRVWLYGHLPLHGAMILGALAVERAVLHPLDRFENHEAWVFPLGFTVAMLFMHVIYNTSVPREMRRKHWKFTMPHNVFTAIGLAMIPVSTLMSSAYVVMVYLALMLGHVAMTLRGYPEEVDRTPYRPESD